jgi:hypothetical protein
MGTMPGVFGYGRCIASEPLQVGSQVAARPASTFRYDFDADDVCAVVERTL